MVSRPLLYLSLPGVAFLLGVFWYRRRNKNRHNNNDDANSNNIDKEALRKEVEEELIRKINSNGIQNMATPPIPSSSMNINGGNNVSPDDTVTKLFGKSAPIQIIQNSRGSPVKQTKQQQVDSEVLKTKIQDAEHKVLRSIDEDFENMSSPVDLPDSVSNRMPFYARTVNTKNDEPVVIKATRTPKISPENSFLESKYTKGCNEHSSTDPKQNQSEGIELNQEKQTESQTETQKQELQNTQIEKDIVESDGNEKRNVDAASPSLSLCSVQSGDSGKGSSLPRSEATRAKTTYEFFFPNILVGQLYGRKRSFINQIKTETSANVMLRKNRIAGKVRICVVEGTESEISAALAMIRQRLPAKRYPNFTMQKIHYALPQTIVPLSNESLLNLKLQLIEGINNDVVVSAVISASQIFVQHPLHPSHPSLAVLQKFLYDSYTTMEAPLLPSVEIGAVCVLPVNGIWYRVEIVQADSEEEMRCVVKFLDFGGFLNVHFNELRQIKSDFMTVPFQATECVLSNIEPIDSSGWIPEAAEVLSNLTKGIILQAQVAGYNSHNMPEIYLFACLGPNNVIFINKELVARNIAKWVEVRD